MASGSTTCSAGARATATSWLPAGYAPVPDEQVLRHLVPDIADHDVYVCGPDAWTEAVLDTARRAGVADDRVHAERFAW